MTEYDWDQPYNRTAADIITSAEETLSDYADVSLQAIQDFAAGGGHPVDGVPAFQTGPFLVMRKMEIAIHELIAAIRQAPGDAADRVVRCAGHLGSEEQP
jgi:hypothetical protein